MMTQSIEAFVEKLHTEGVEAGRKAADQLRGEAQSEADRIIDAAKAEAEAIVAEAQAQAKRTTDRERSELDLALRDTVLAFRSRISGAVESLLSAEVGATLTDTEFLAQLIRDVVLNYAHEDARSDEQIQININPDAVEAVTDWALKYLAGDHAARANVDLKSTLKTVGFEYRVSESTVEVTLESIVEALRDQVSPRLREALDRALAEPAQ